MFAKTGMTRIDGIQHTAHIIVLHNQVIGHDFELERALIKRFERKKRLTTDFPRANSQTIPLSHRLF